MMNTDREDLRLLITEFNDGPMGCADDFAWRRHLKTYEDLLAEVERLRQENTTQAQLLSRLVGRIADAKRSIEYTVDAELNVNLKHTLDMIKEMIE